MELSKKQIGSFAAIAGAAAAIVATLLINSGKSDIAQADAVKGVYPAEQCSTNGTGGGTGSGTGGGSTEVPDVTEATTVKKVVKKEVTKQSVLSNILNHNHILNDNTVKVLNDVVDVSDVSVDVVDNVNVNDVLNPVTSVLSNVEL